MLGFAIVGCGMIARFHARALADVPDARLVALVSRTPANARAVADAAGRPCESYSELKPVLDRRDVDVVIVTTPSRAHLEPAVAAAPSAAPAAEWGALPALMLLPALIVLIVVGLMGFELVQGMWGYHQPTKSTSLVTTEIAKMFDVAPKE